MAYLMVSESVCKIWFAMAQEEPYWYIWRDVQGDFRLGSLHSLYFGLPLEEILPSMSSLFSFKLISLSRLGAS
jgi:hypothetical protein